MPWLDLFLVSVLALWALSAVLFNLPVPALHAWLSQINGSRLFARWSLFSPSNAAMRPGIFEIHFRDRAADGRVSDWQRAASGFRWGWTALFWLPERFVATAVQNLGRQIRTCFAQRPPLTREGMACARLLEAHVDRHYPRPADKEREFRIVRTFSRDGTMEKVLEFTGRSHVSGG